MLKPVGATHFPLPAALASLLQWTETVGMIRLLVGMRRPYRVKRHAPPLVTRVRVRRIR